jgi:hypothetical protein
LRANLAKGLAVTGDVAGAEKLGAAALAAHEASLGVAHPWTADSAAILARALDAGGRNSDADALRRRYGVKQPATDGSTG